MNKRIGKNLLSEEEEGIFVIKSFFKGIYTKIFIIKNGSDVLIIDSGILSSFSMIKEVLNKIKYRNIFIINTHSHWDHIGSNCLLKREYNCLIMGHFNGLEYFANSWTQWEEHYNKKEYVIKPTLYDKKVFFKEFKEGVSLDILLTNNEIININNNRYQIIHTPGHSSCSIIIYNLDSKYLYSGDVLSGNGVNNGIVFVDNFDEYLNSLSLIKELKINKLFSSHFKVKRGIEINKFVDTSLNELLNYEKIIMELIKNNEKLSLMDLINEFENIAGKKKNIFLESSIRKIILSLIKNDFISKEKSILLSN